MRNLKNLKFLNLKTHDQKMTPHDCKSKMSCFLIYKLEENFILLDRQLISSLSVEDFIYNHKPSQYLTDIHNYKTNLRNSVNYGRIKDIHESPSFNIRK